MSTKKQVHIDNSLFSGVTDIQEFVIWAKKQGLKTFSGGGISFEVSETARALESMEAPVQRTEERDTKATLLDSEPEDADNDDELLFHSTI